MRQKLSLMVEKDLTLKNTASKMREAHYLTNPP